MPVVNFHCLYTWYVLITIIIYVILYIYVCIIAPCLVNSSINVIICRHWRKAQPMSISKTKKKKSNSLEILAPKFLGLSRTVSLTPSDWCSSAPVVSGSWVHDSPHEGTRPGRRLRLLPLTSIHLGPHIRNLSGLPKFLLKISSSSLWNQLNIKFIKDRSQENVWTSLKIKKKTMNNDNEYIKMNPAWIRFVFIPMQSQNVLFHKAHMEEGAFEGKAV